MEAEVLSEQQNENLGLSKEQMDYLRNLSSNHQINNPVTDIGLFPT